MTTELKPLMEHAADRPTAFVPDLERLLADGRRRARSHFVVTTVGTVAAVAVAAIGGAIALHPGGGSGPAVLPAPPAGRATSNPTAPKTVTRCLDEAGQPSPKGADKWQPMVSVKDKYGSSAVRRSAGQLAFCTEFRGKPTSVTQQTSLPRASVWLVPVCGTDPSCTGIMTVFMGQLPAKAVRLTVTPSGGGKPADATIRDGFFAYRWVAVPDVTRPPIGTTYDAAGRKLGTFRI